MNAIYIFLLFALPLASLAVQANRVSRKAAECDKGWLTYNNSCYSVGQEAMNWPSAVAACTALGGYLAEVTDKAEHDWIVAQLQGVKSGSIWLGGSDLLSEGVWLWHSSKKLLGPVSFWYPGQPDNGVKGEFCLEMRDEFGYMWNDISCLTMNKFLCESEL